MRFHPPSAAAAATVVADSTSGLNEERKSTIRRLYRTLQTNDIKGADRMPSMTPAELCEAARLNSLCLDICPKIRFVCLRLNVTTYNRAVFLRVRGR